MKYKKTGFWKFYSKKIIQNSDIKYSYKNEKKYVCHHILTVSKYPQFVFANWNIIVLGKRKHNAFHKKYGKTKCTIQDLICFLKKDISIKTYNHLLTLQIKYQNSPK